ncbi:MAG: class fumarate hydratase, partial [Rhodoglobus sp.]|nr:class fumarate hydratase [Rhodoglobus sp.]
MSTEEFRIEHDTMGEVRVPASALYGAQTQRAVENFPISGSGLEPAQIVALARIKRAAALANKQIGILDAPIADAIAASADEIIAGRHHDQFPIDTYQTGSGTSSNMNINEVLASLATTRLGSPVHPNDHVNMSQSSNDVFPTSVHVAVVGDLIHNLIPSLDHLAVSLEAKAKLWATAVSEAAAAVARGDWDAHFPIDVFQTGSGTSSNMNTNEVIASLATEALGSPVHPNDHVNA